MVACSSFFFFISVEDDKKFDRFEISDIAYDILDGRFFYPRFLFCEQHKSEKFLQDI